MYKNIKARKLCTLFSGKLYFKNIYAVFKTQK